jgi:endonuclease YncB( thermonuclease family)
MSGSGVDRYGRELRQVFVNGVDVAGVMISAGLARSYDGGKKQGWC